MVEAALPADATVIAYLVDYFLEAHRKEATRALGDLRQDLLQVVEVDGTWLDFPDLGKPYATAAALLVLDLSR